MPTLGLCLFGQSCRSLRSGSSESGSNRKPLCRRTDGTISTMLSTGVDGFPATATKVRRETTKSRLLLVGLAGAMLLILVFTPYRTLVHREFPRLDPVQAPPLQISLLPPDTAFSETPPPEENNEVQVRMPLRVSGIASGSVVIVSGVLFRIESLNGVQWDSGWKSPGLFLFPEQDRSQIGFALKKNLFERFKSSPVKVQVSLALSVFHDQNARELVTPAGSFLLPEVGRCSAEGGYFRRIHCLAPLRGPSFLLMRADMSKNTCPPAKGESPRSPGAASLPNLRGEP